MTDSSDDVEIKGEALAHARREAVWSALHDTEILRRCVPGCESIRWLDGETLEASLVLKIGTARRRYQGIVRIADAVEPQSYRLLLGSDPESPSVESGMRLEPHADGTAIHYQVQARLDGYFNLLGARAAAGVARRLAARFFKRLDAALRETKAAAKHD